MGVGAGGGGGEYDDSFKLLNLKKKSSEKHLWKGNKVLGFMQMNQSDCNIIIRAAIPTPPWSGPSWSMHPVPGTLSPERYPATWTGPTLGCQIYIQGLQWHNTWLRRIRNHATRPSLGKFRREKESKQVCDAGHDQQQACTHRQTRIPAARWPTALRIFFFPGTLGEWNQLLQWHNRAPPPEAFMGGLGTDAQRHRLSAA